jgi:hypothetical protein
MINNNQIPQKTRVLHDPGRRIRVGDDYSPVMPGDPSPGGGVYRSGQYSPHVDDLAVATFSSANVAGIIPADLPIFDENGEVDIERLDAWNPSQEGLSVSFAPDIPNYSSAVVVSSLKQLGDSFLSNYNLSVMQAPRTFGYFGNYVIAARTSFENRNFSSGLYVYPDFYKFIDKPMVPKTPKRQSGISVSSFLTFHAMGHIVVSKLSFMGKISAIAEFMDSSGWNKTKDGIHSKASFMGRDSTSAWYYGTGNRFTSEISMYSPLDDFAQAFAFYYTNAEYLEKTQPKKFEIIKKVIAGI